MHTVTSGTAAWRHKKKGHCVNLAEQGPHEQRGEEQTAAEASRQGHHAGGQFDGKKGDQCRERVICGNVKGKSAVPRAHDLRSGGGQSGHEQGADDRPRPNRHMRRLKRFFRQACHAHCGNPESRGAGGETQERGIAGQAKGCDRRSCNLVRSSDEKMCRKDAHDGRCEDRTGAGDRIGAEDNFERIESAGQWRAERAAYRGSRACADQKAQIATTQAQFLPEERSEAGPHLCVACLQANRRSARIRNQRLRAHNKTIAQRHATAAQCVGLDGIDSAGNIAPYPPCLHQA